MQFFCYKDIIAFMVETSIQIQNKKGIHVRPSGLIFKAIAGYPGTITVVKGKVRTEIRDIISILTLGLAYNDSITIEVDGDNESEMLKTLSELFSKDFHFEEQ